MSFQSSLYHSAFGPAGGVAALMTAGAWDADQLASYQNGRLRALVRHAWERVPFYRRKFAAAGLDPRDIRTTADLARIPITTRTEMQDADPRDVVAPPYDPERLRVSHTSGSAGQPLVIRRADFEDRLLRAFWLRAMLRVGVRPTDLVATIMKVRGRSMPSGIAGLGLFRSVMVDALLPREHVLAQLRDLQPDILRGYPGAIAWLAGIAGGEIRPRMVITGGETLTPVMAQQMREAFRAPVFNFYSSQEFNLIASECPAHGPLHVSSETVLVEILRDGRVVEPGQEGELVATALCSFAMPFIRYRLGDWLMAGERRCACGAPHVCIRALEGRVMDQFHLPGGRVLHPYTLTVPLISATPWIRRYRIVQEQPDALAVEAIASRPPRPDELSAAEGILATAAGGSIRVCIRLVEQLPPSTGGKFRQYIPYAQPQAEAEKLAAQGQGAQ
jgi:phenylacetate-CoA ligase